MPAEIDVLRALAHPVRWGILERLAAEPGICACDFTEFFEVSQPTISAHLKTLREAGLHPPMKVMMVTTEADNSYIRQALDNGADEFLMKPFTPESLREKMLLLGVIAAYETNAFPFAPPR